jgi:hypothetical protein
MLVEVNEMSQGSNIPPVLLLGLTVGLRVIGAGDVGFDAERGCEGLPEV